MNLVGRSLLITAGVVCVGLGIAGIFLPLLPTTPFLLLAAACFARSSPRLLHWLNNNRWFGAYIRNYREGRGIPMREKVVSITLIWITIGVSIGYFITLPVIEILLVLIALGVTIHLLRIKTLTSAIDE